MSRLMTPEEAARWAQEQITAAIQRTLEEKPALADLYQQRLEDQAQIDRLKKEGRPIPESLVANPFLLRILSDQGHILVDKQRASL